MGLATKLGGLRRLVRSTSTIRRAHGIGYRTQWTEFRYFNRAIAINRAEFIGYGLWDVARPLGERLTMLSNHDRRLIEYRMNPRTPNLQVRDKAWATAELMDRGVPVAPVLGLVALSGDAVPATDRWPVRRGREALLDLLAESPPSGLVVKPLDGEGGRGVQVFAAASRSGLQHLDGRHWSVDDLVALLQSEPLWKVEARLETHPALREIAGPTLGTLRLTTFRMRDGTIHLTPTGWKIPVGDSGVDHFSHGDGQLCAPVEAATGRLGPARYWFRLDVRDRHPHTGRPIAGAVMPAAVAAAAVCPRKVRRLTESDIISFSVE